MLVQNFRRLAAALLSLSQHFLRAAYFKCFLDSKGAGSGGWADVGGLHGCHLPHGRLSGPAASAGHMFPLEQYHQKSRLLLPLRRQRDCVPALLSGQDYRRRLGAAVFRRLEEATEGAR